MGKKITEIQKSRVVELYTAGTKVPEISTEVGISPTSIAKILKEHGITSERSTSSTKRRFSKEDKAEMIRLYTEEGKNTNEIAALYGTYNTSIRRILEANNIELRGRGVAQRAVSLEDIQCHVGSFDFDYFLGLLATDGCITDGKVILDFSEENKELLDYWNEFLGNKCNITCSLHKTYQVPQYRIAFRNNEVIELLSEYGIVPNKTFDLRLKYVNWDVFRGIIDGDGCIASMNNGSTLRVIVTSGCRSFLEQLQEFLLSYNIDSKIRIDSRSVNPVYSLMVDKSEDVLTIYSKMYSNAHYFLKRKELKFGPLLKKFNRCSLVNSGKETCDSNPEPSLRNGEGVETLHEAPTDIFVYGEEKVQA